MTLLINTIIFICFLIVILKFDHHLIWIMYFCFIGLHVLFSFHLDFLSQMKGATYTERENTNRFYVSFLFCASLIL